MLRTLASCWNKENLDAMRHFSSTCAVHIEDYEGWWLSGCRSSVAEHWLHKPGVLGSIPGDCRPFRFRLITSKFSLPKFMLVPETPPQSLAVHTASDCNGGFSLVSRPHS